MPSLCFWGQQQSQRLTPSFGMSNPDCHLEISFNEELAHLIYAAADMVLVPSNYEPCGLTQIIGLKYGTVPIVRGVGGLVNTVFDRDYDTDRKPEKRNGYVFYQSDFPALESAIARGIGLWYDYPKEFRKLAMQGMEYDYSWRNPAAEYVKIYERIRHQWNVSPALSELDSVESNPSFPEDILLQ
jgi:starch synthase